MITSGLMSSNSDRWETPQDLFDQLNQRYSFEIDVCALPENAKCETYFTPEVDGLSQDWTGVCWMNPPYGREIGKWMKKALESSRNGATVVCLVPARTDTAWWHDYAMKGEIEFIRGRLNFGNSKNSAPFPSAIVVFGGADERKDDKLYEREVCEACGGDGTVLLTDGYEGQVMATVKCIYCNGTGRVNKECEE